MEVNCIIALTRIVAMLQVAKLTPNLFEYSLYLITIPRRFGCVDVKQFYAA